MNWTPERCTELDVLDRLLSECCLLNSSSGIVERIQRIEDLAFQLVSDDARTPRESFSMFLKRLAIAERSAK